LIFIQNNVLKCFTVQFALKMQRNSTNFQTAYSTYSLQHKYNKLKYSNPHLEY